MSDTGGAGEQVVVMFMESGTDSARDAVVAALEQRGFDVYSATPDGAGAALVFAYEAARYLAVALTGEPAPPAPTGEPTRASSSMPEARDEPNPESVRGVKALVFPGAPQAQEQSEVYHLTWDRNSHWLDTLVAAIKSLEHG